MKALILAAGYATRLYPLTKDRPKPLLPIGGRALIDYLVDQLETLDELDGIAVVTNHRFASHFRDWARARQARLPLEVLDDGTDTPENRLGAIGDAAWTIRTLGLDEPLLIAAADNIFPFSFRDFAAFARAKGTDCLPCYRLDDPERLKRTGIVAVSPEGRVLRFEEKSPEPWSDLSVPPAYLYQRETLPLFEEYLSGGNNPDAPGNFVPWLLARRPVHAFRFEGYVMDIGTPKSYAAACRAFELKGGASPIGSPRAQEAREGGS
ncbi:MAG TPA: nucleotidyltransferase family protein [Armatimonadetes bacterium]|jgi:glucose-1-phosphate thymidylyltransferase|nr:nucleotidyltransferase family protein [Armatimonadota bacterium]